MYTLEISDESLKKLEKIGKEFSGMDNKIVKEALRKALNYAKKEEKKFIKSRYSLQQKVDANSLKSKITSTDGVLLGSTKRNKVSEFAISKPNPGKSKQYIKTKIIKPRPEMTWKTLFWAFWKNGNPKLMFRVGKERHKITLATSLSVRNMGLQIDNEKIYEEIQKIFSKVLEERIDELWRE